MHIALLTSSASRLGGGVATAVHGHAAMLQGLGARVTVVALEDEFTTEDRDALGSVPLLTSKVIGPSFFGYSPDLAGLLLGLNADVLHIHGIWMYPSRAGYQWAKSTGRPYLISPHGMLDPWITARGRWKKALARLFYERASWRSARAFHALTHDEAADIRREAGDRPVLVIPNSGPPALSRPPAERPPTVVYLGRIHPKKNIAALITAWDACDRPDGAELVIAGWGADADVAELELQVARASGSVRFIGPVHGADKQELVGSARFLALPSFSEGLPMVILEAWAAGTPTIMTSACHLPEGFDAGAAIECGTDSSSISAAIARGLSMGSSEWSGMATSALKLARQDFSPNTVAGSWASAYRELVEGKPG